MTGKYDSFRDSALHFMCESEWHSGEFGDQSTYGTYIWRISNTEADVATENGEFNSLLEEWQNVKDADSNSDEFRESLVGHFIVSENDLGFVYVRKFDTEAQRDARYNDFLTHFIEWSAYKG